MSEPTPPSDVQSSGLPPMPVPPPVRAGGDPTVRPKQVFLGMLLGWGICVGSALATAGLAWAITSLVGGSAPNFGALSVVMSVAPVVPVAALVWSIRRAARTGRKGLAIGMALFAGLAILLAAACVGTLFLVYSGA